MPVLSVFFTAAAAASALAFASATVSAGVSVASVAAPGVPCRTPIAIGLKLALLGPADVAQPAAAI